MVFNVKNHLNKPVKNKLICFEEIRIWKNTSNEHAK